MEVSKYQRGKIYKIVDNTNDDVYIGSTCESTLARRLVQHRADYNKYLKGNHNYTTSFKIIANGDYDIVLIENYPCNSKDELHARERYWTQNTNCVNKVKNQGLLKELGQKEYDKVKGKEYRATNKEAIKVRRSKLVTCECGVTYTHDHASRHKRCKKHLSYVKMMDELSKLNKMEEERKERQKNIDQLFNDIMNKWN